MMKNLKLSRTSWLILSAGIFIVVLAGLGLTRSQQIEEKTKLEEELSINEMRLNKFNVTQLQQQRDELQEQLDDNTMRLNMAKYSLSATVQSLDVTDEFFFIASKCNVTVNSISSSSIGSDSIRGIGCSTISLNASVSGELSNMIDFIISLNHDYTTGYVKSAQVSVSEENSSASIQMIIYSYEGA
jgi:TolA-binding protein